MVAGQVAPQGVLLFKQGTLGSGGSSSGGSKQKVVVCIVRYATNVLKFDYFIFLMCLFFIVIRKEIARMAGTALVYQKCTPALVLWDNLVGCLLPRSTSAV